MTTKVTLENGRTVTFYGIHDVVASGQKAVTKFIQKGYAIVSSTPNADIDVLDIELQRKRRIVKVEYSTQLMDISGLPTKVTTLLVDGEPVKRFFEVEKGLWTVSVNLMRQINKSKESLEKDSLLSDEVALIDATTPTTVALAKKLKGFRTVAKKNIVVEKVDGKEEYIVRNKTNSRNKKVLVLN